MIELKSILSPVDFSDRSRHALEHAAQLARWFDATVTILYVYPPPAVPPPVLHGGMPAAMPVEPISPLTEPPLATPKEIHAELEKFASSVDVTGADVRLNVRPGGAVDGILAEAAAGRSDLVVIGTHGRSGFERLVLGSVAEKVLRQAPCPVLTVPPRATAPPAGGLQLFKRTLCPVDFSDSSLKALDYVFSIAKEADAAVLVVHVVEGVPDEEGWLTRPAIVEHLRVLEGEALERLSAAIPEDARPWCRPETLLVRGKAYREVLRIAAARDVSLIAMGVQGRGAADKWFFGSTATHVVRAASCPVLSLRA